MSVLQSQTLGDTRLRVIFVDADDSHVRRYASVVQKICGTQGITTQVVYYPKGEQLLADLSRNRTEPTIVIAEPALPEDKGLTTLRNVRAQDMNCQIILLSENPAYALEGYEVDAVAYLLKKATPLEVFQEAFTRALDRVIEQNHQYVTFSCGGFSQTIRLSDILYFEVVKKVVTVYYLGGNFEFYSTLGKIEDTLASHGFMRVHRNYIVSLDKIARLDKDELVLETSDRIPVGRSYRKDLLSAIHLLNEAGVIHA